MLGKIGKDGRPHEFRGTPRESKTGIGRTTLKETIGFIQLLPGFELLIVGKVVERAAEQLQAFLNDTLAQDLFQTSFFLGWRQCSQMAFTGSWIKANQSISSI